MSTTTIDGGAVSKREEDRCYKTMGNLLEWRESKKRYTNLTLTWGRSRPLSRTDRLR